MVLLQTPEFGVNGRAWGGSQPEMGSCCPRLGEGWESHCLVQMSSCAALGLAMDKKHWFSCSTALGSPCPLPISLGNVFKAFLKASGQSTHTLQSMEGGDVMTLCPHQAGGRMELPKLCVKLCEAAHSGSLPAWLSHSG